MFTRDAATTSSPSLRGQGRARSRSRSRSSPTRRAVALAIAACVSSALPAVATAEVSATALAWLEDAEPLLQTTATFLWEHAEPAHREVRTAAYLTETLTEAGFEVETGVAGLPTAFVASYGDGEPVIGIVALLDALPGLSQQRAVSERTPLEDLDAGHGCGHHLIMAADLLAAIALAKGMAAHELTGTVRLYGAPAEEIYHGGVFMARAGVFDDADTLLFWHPSSVTSVIARSGLAMDSVRYVYEGLASDATDAADKGRSALAAARAFLDAIDDARPLLPETAVINAVLLEGGLVPSIVPERATAWLFVHDRDRPAVGELRARVDALAGEAARRSATHLTIQHLSATRDWLVNKRLAEALQPRLERVTAEPYRTSELAFAESLRSAFADDAGGETFFTGSLPLAFGDVPVSISDDTADASWIAPRAGFLIAAYPAGIPSHTWQWTAAGLSDFALEGAMRAARVLVDLSADLLTDDDLRAEVAREYRDAMGGRVYRSPLPDGREPFDFIPRR